MPWSGEDTGEKDDEAAREESTQPILEGGYTPLRRSFEIRLLAIHPGEGDCQVECSLRHRKLRGNLQYEALSYVWGEATKISEVVCDGKPREVRGNLYDALKQLREPDQERFVWVDQLCINQEDNAEKTQQVRIMGEIYSRAQRVLIWLGKDVEMEKSLNLLLKTFNNRGGLDVRGINWDPVLHVFSNQWFHRVWCIQELVLSKTPVLVSGNSTVSWEDFVMAGRWVRKQLSLSDNSGRYARTLEHLDVLQTMRDTRKKTHWRERHTLLQLLFLTRGFQATDPRDKIFALVGLAGDVMSSDWEVTPNYDLSLPEVYRRFALWHLTRKQQIEIFSFGVDKDLQPTKDLEDLPSWVPDLTRPDLAAPLPKLEYLSVNYIDIRYDIMKEFNLRRGHFKAGTKVYHADLRLPWWGMGRRSHFEPPRIAFTEGTNVIHLLGTEIGTLKTIGQLIDETRPASQPVLNWHLGIDPDRFLRIGQWLRDSWRLVAAETGGSKHEVPDEVFEAAWRTMICDMTSTGHAVNSRIYRRSSREVYDSFCEYELKKEYEEAIRGAWDTPTVCKPQDDAEPHAATAAGGAANDAIDRKKIEGSLEKQLRTQMTTNKWYQARRFGITTSGDFAAVPKAARQGDIICVFNGGRVPYVLRPGKQGYYQLVGECYVHGMMRGEVKDNFPRADHEKSFAIR
ncbi:heterokaryon incompatibility protein-domain-containing protein [Dactylonectria macrodidyma]|uniref:Heterokaryon incompatibility protein-domain-containing protein n=1 Tax=Dactylonectria macrodidyma TaxID=307937 RepID=A0A9P9ISS1_9HYPO|nr:heterokaryon incompatibility protein-domain-containing protein [Dactylonectria macrodidyma]